MSTPSYGETITGGIQDISALLPLLGTEQCESHVGSALSDGYLFAAATPLSIFGTLGLVNAGFKAAIATIDIPRWGYLGAEKLRDAGFRPSGKNLALIMMDPANRKRYLVETRLCELMKDVGLENDGQVYVSFNLEWWNIKMAVATAAFCIANLAAYIELILHNDNRVRAIFRLIFPVMRILGSFLTVVSLQILLQRRTTNLTRARELFGQLDSILRKYHPNLLGKLTDDVDAIWDTMIASDKCLSSLRSLACSHVSDDQRFREELECFARGKLLAASDRLWEWPFVFLTLLGAFGSVVGYIGCFTIVQGYAGSLLGPLLWLGAETTLSIIRVLIWSLNPKFDDAPLLKLQPNRKDDIFDKVLPFVTQREPSSLPDVEINGLELNVQRAYQSLQSLSRHSGIFIERLDRRAFPNRSFLYSLTPRKTGLKLDLFILIVDDNEVDQMARVYYQENEMSKFRFATYTARHVEGPVVFGRPKPEGYQIRGGSVVVGGLIHDISKDHVASDTHLQAALRRQYWSILEASKVQVNEVLLNRELTKRKKRVQVRPDSRDRWAGRKTSIDRTPEAVELGWQGEKQV